MSNTSKMINCKTCGTEIAATAAQCPNCGAKQKRKHPAAVIIICLLIGIFIIISVATNDNGPKKVGNTDTVAQDSNVEESIFGVGDIVELNGITTTFIGFKESKGSEFNRPESGNIFVLCDFEIANNSDSEIAVSSLLSFSGYCDSYACDFSISALLERGSTDSLDGTVAPGKKMKGSIGYEIPKDWQELEIHYTPDFWQGKDIVFVAKH